MRRLKSFLCVLSACALVMSLSGCGGDSRRSPAMKSFGSWPIPSPRTSPCTRLSCRWPKMLKRRQTEFVIEIYPTSPDGWQPRGCWRACSLIPSNDDAQRGHVGRLFRPDLRTGATPISLRTSLILKMLTPSIIPIFSSPSTMTWRTPASCGLALGIRETAI